MGRRPKQTFLQKERWPINTWKDAQHHSLEKLKSKLQWGATSHQSEWPSSNNYMLEQMWRKGNLLVLLVGMHIGTASVENTREIPWQSRTKPPRCCCLVPRLYLFAAPWTAARQDSLSLTIFFSEYICISGTAGHRAVVGVFFTVFSFNCI